VKGIEPGEHGGFRARAGEPFGVSADGSTAREAAEHLATLLRDRLQSGAHLAFIDLPNGPQVHSPVPLQFEPLPDEDWFFETMRQAIAENRQREDEASR
jgi:hypothetical protein